MEESQQVNNWPKGGMNAVELGYMWINIDEETKMDVGLEDVCEGDV